MLNEQIFDLHEFFWSHNSKKKSIFDSINIGNGIFF
jgi:hypothetical protein